MLILHKRTLKLRVVKWLIQDHRAKGEMTQELKSGPPCASPALCYRQALSSNRTPGVYGLCAVSCQSLSSVRAKASSALLTALPQSLGQCLVQSRGSDICMMQSCIMDSSCLDLSLFCSSFLRFLWWNQLWWLRSVSKSAEASLTGARSHMLIKIWEKY